MKYGKMVFIGPGDPCFGMKSAKSTLEGVFSWSVKNNGFYDSESADQNAVVKIISVAAPSIPSKMVGASPSFQRCLLIYPVGTVDVQQIAHGKKKEGSGFPTRVPE